MFRNERSLRNADMTKVMPRQSNFELLRIIAMIMIIAHHFSIHGGFDFSNDSVTINKLWIQFLQIGGKIGVNVFILISGYFLISEKSFRTNKAIKLWIQILSYSILIFTVFIVMGIEPFGIKELIKHCFPIIFSQWWFASTYFVLYLLSPYLNSFLISFEKKQYQQFLFLLTFIWCIIPTFTGRTLQGNELLWLIYLYALVGYIKLHGCKTNIKGTVYILLSFATLILTFLSAVVFDLLGTKMVFFGNHATFFYGMQKLPVLIISVLMFIGFSKIDIGCKRAINIISSATFGVYLLHDDPYIRPFLWNIVFRNASYSDSNLLIPYSLAVIIIVFILCTIVELVRIYALEKHYMGAVNFIANKVDRLKNKIFSLKIFSY